MLHIGALHSVFLWAFIDTPGRIGHTHTPHKSLSLFPVSPVGYKKNPKAFNGLQMLDHPQKYLLYSLSVPCI
jgi:hypothetical protein